jgi:hypothetical protein
MVRFHVCQSTSFDTGYSGINNHPFFYESQGRDAAPFDTHAGLSGLTSLVVCPKTLIRCGAQVSDLTEWESREFTGQKEMFL